MLVHFWCYTGLAVQFAQSAYTIDEDDGSLQAMLVFSSSSSYGITVLVLNSDESAIGILCND